MLLTSSTITCLLGLICVLAFAWIFQLDKGTAAGLGAGGLTQSAMIGSANNAIAAISSLPESIIHTMQLTSLLDMPYAIFLDLLGQLFY